MWLFLPYVFCTIRYLHDRVFNISRGRFLGAKTNKLTHSKAQIKSAFVSCERDKRDSDCRKKKNSRFGIVSL